MAVDEQLPPVQQHSVLDDPAVIGVRRSIGFTSISFSFVLFFVSFPTFPSSEKWTLAYCRCHPPFPILPPLLGYPLPQLTNVLVP